MQDAIKILNDLENYIGSKWGLEIKPSSKGVVIAKGGSTDYDHQVWGQPYELKVLGHLICSDAGIYREWRSCRPILRSVFWKNSGSLKALEKDHPDIAKKYKTRKKTYERMWTQNLVLLG